MTCADDLLMFARKGTEDDGTPVTESAMLITRRILRFGEARLAGVLGIGPTEMSRKTNNQTGFTIKQMGVALESVGIRLIAVDDEVVVMPKGEYEALKTLAGRYFGRE